MEPGLRERELNVGSGAACAVPPPACLPAPAFASAPAEDTSDDEEDDEDGTVRAKWSCDALRRKITLYLATKEQTQTAWCKSIGVGPPSFASFMKQKGTWKGTGNGTFRGATRFFLAREKAAKAASAADKALPPAERKRKAADASGERAAKKAAGDALLARIAATPLPAADCDEFGRPRCFDDCDDVRKACAAFVAEGLCTQAAFLAALDPSGAPVNGNSLGTFLRIKGATAGAGSKMFPLAYAFFEKRRIAEGRPKSAKRLRAEIEFPFGRSCETDYSGREKMWFCVPLGA
jgi:hypothetical protein